MRDHLAWRLAFEVTTPSLRTRDDGTEGMLRLELAPQRERKDRYAHTPAQRHRGLHGIEDRSIQSVAAARRPGQPLCPLCRPRVLAPFPARARPAHLHHRLMLR